MKREIDLTERNDFSSFGDSRVIQEKQKSYRHKSTPWKRGADDESVPLKMIDSTGYFYTTTSSNSSSVGLSMNSSFTSNHAWRLRFNHINDDLSDNVMRFTINKNRHGDEVDSFVYSINYNLNSKKFICYSSDGSIVYLSDQPANNNIFPTGKKEEIKALRYTKILRDKYKEEKKTYTCDCCGKRFKVKPWGDYNTEDYKILCDECYKTILAKNETKKSYPRDKILVDRWAGSLPNRFTANFYRIAPPMHMTHHRLFQVIAFDIPSLSSDMKDEFIQPRFPEGFREWDYEDVYEEHVLEFNMHTDKNKVYTKGQSRRGLRRREEPWQPNGRISQPYDQMFDRMDWRDMLKLRLGELDGPLAKEPENRIHISNDSNFTLNSFNHIDFDWHIV